MEILQALEASRFAMFIKESGTAYTTFLAFHTVGLAFLVGIGGGASLRILGVAPRLPLAPIADFFPLMWAGFWINAVTGLVLLCLYPTKFLTDGTMYIKLGAVALAVISTRMMSTQVFAEGERLETAAAARKAKWLASATLVLWLIAITAGRVTAYTLPTKLQTAAAVLVATVAMLLVGYLVVRSLGGIKASSQGVDGATGG